MRKFCIYCAGGGFMNEKEIIVANGYTYPTIDPEILSSWLPALTLISSFSYGLKTDGSLIGLDDSSVLAAADANGTGGLMVLTARNEDGSFDSDILSDFFNTPGAEDALIRNILSLLAEKEFFGIDFDFEYVPAENRDQYTALVTKTAERCNEAGFLVTVALAPKTSADQSGLLYQGHDYYGMGQGANFVLLMTYEWGYTFGPPLPVAPLPEVRRVLEYGLSEIAPDKILMGIPNYGYDWTLPFIQGQSRAERISNPEAKSRAERVGVEIQYSERDQSPYYYYTDSLGAEHVVWFEDERSWRAKFELVREYGLAGLSIWNIVDAFPEGTALLTEFFDILKV